MKPLTRDISVTLIIKLSLLFALWFVCFRGVQKPVQSTRDWLLGTNPSSDNRMYDDKRGDL